ncbi:bifunctional nitrogenase molybdenum-cofactor biosynthesis protein [Leptolyngbya sp. Heron Island J]|uniref:bifunctional nitrogenase iron-molybdenum cofactor biosynthesis protein NifEN n=1 Tax=Leptolyngbya sp. Heron Island J TaxID=1385935 RepID=UPI0003B94914|nr:bifunctional nitrogenase iron-molybdenum cofactor biosynthesis protein NifEN [Leptolyngbya sp. Heron Island J]ESA32430.1 bifunctional nitrogenase molybdenum-cofactor biosynthesis protein [Leptolyngbya sp. Heron Island J]
MKMTSGKINELLTQPGCEHNHKKDGKGQKKACQQQAQPGAAQGGCAFDGASIALVPITDVAHLVHGPIACSGNSWGSRGSLSSGPMIYKMGFTTDLSENDIIFGGENKLYKAIHNVKERYSPAAIFVYLTCVTALIGDDLDAVCQAASKKFDIPVVPVSSPGFVGSKNLGNRIGGEALLEHVVGTREPEYTTPYDINLIGEYNIAGEMWGLLPLLEKLGIRVLAKITGDARYNEVACAHRAKLNVMICSKALINMAHKMEERYGIPYIEESIYGIEDMNRLLREIAAKLGDSDLQARVETLIKEETSKLAIALTPYRQRLKGKRVVLYTGGVKSWSIISAAKDLGIEVVATSTKKSTEEDKARIKDLLGKDGIMMKKGNAQELLRVIAKTKADMLIAGGRNQYTALKARIPFLDINQERHHPYAGYVGMIEMAKELDEALHSPIWEQVRRESPWDSVGGAWDRAGASLAHSAQPLTKVLSRRKPVAVNPLKQSQPLGAALAYLGIKGMMPLFHGSQGCTAFAKVMLVRHFREAIPLSTTAMTEVTTILGGEGNVETAILTLLEKTKPAIIGLCTTGLTETRGDDMQGILKEFRQRHPELSSLPIAFASTPDFKGALQDGYAAAVEALVRDIPDSGQDELRQQGSDSFYTYAAPGMPSQVTVLAGSSLAPGDVQAIKDMVTAFGLNPVFVPDLSKSLDGHLADSYSGLTNGGTTLHQLKSLAYSSFTLAIGNSMKLAAEILQQRFGTEFRLFNSLTGLGAVDSFLQELAELSGRPVPEKFRHQRRQLQDAILDTHFFFGRKRVALALEPDLLHRIAWWLTTTGAEIHAAVTTTKSKLLKHLPADTVTIGDFEDFEDLAQGADLLIANSNAKAIAKRLGIPLYRLGFPVFDRLGNGQRYTVGYDGTTQLLFDIGNIFMEVDEVDAHAQVHAWREGHM